jgi:hypothetical protein
LPSARRQLLSEQRQRPALAHGLSSNIANCDRVASVSLLAGAAGDALAARGGAAARERSDPLYETCTPLPKPAFRRDECSISRKAQLPDGATRVLLAGESNTAKA